MSTSTFKAVILAGGSGERFWPLSTPERPKQFLRVFGGASLIRQAVSRLDGLVSPKDVFVVTAKNLVAATRRELPEIPKCNILGEPMRRDTGAAVALGVGLAASDADPVIGFFSSDQMVSNPKAFRKVVSKAVAIARRKPVIVTLGIKPTYPATCFGYISPKTRTFVEKPDAKTAKKYVKAGYLWNAGMFIARASTFRGAFAAHAPELERLTRLETDGTNRTDGTRSRSTAIAGGSLAKLYSALPKISRTGLARAPRRLQTAVWQSFIPLFQRSASTTPSWRRRRTSRSFPATSDGTTSAALPRSTSTSPTTRAATSAKGRARSLRQTATSASPAARASRFSVSRISSS